MPSIKDVADFAGVSTATVSRVLADKPHVRPQVRERVLAAVESLNYRPNLVARSLRVQKSNKIGLIVADIQNPFFTSVSRAVEDLAYNHELSVFLCNTDENPEKEDIYLDLMQDENVAGVIIAPTRQTASAFTEAIKLDLPMVIIDRRLQGIDIDSVSIDNVEAAYRLTEHLISDGHRRIGAMFGLDSVTGSQRYQGYVKALKDHDLQPSSDLVIHVDARAEEGYQAAKALLNRPQRPDAILTSNGLLSVGAFRALHESKVAIPDEIGFASFDETGWTTLVDPPITIIEQPTYEIGQAATELLLQRLKNPTRPAREIILKANLVVRSSCARH